jgi:apolipoprotein N-acyltransferase
VTYRVGVSSPTRYAVRLLGAALAGICLWLAFPTHDLWWLAPVGVGLLALVTLEAGWWRGLGLGLVAGLGCFVPVLSWSGTYVGTLPWMALSTLQALYVALMSALVGYAGRRLLRSGHRGWALALVPPAWVVMEWARSTTPFGGFPWARLAFSQADSPLVYWAAIGGAPLVTGAVAAVGTLTLATAYRLTERSYPGAPWPLAVAAALCALPAVTTLPTQGREVTVGYVQGNVPRAGLDFNAERRAVLDNHVRGTEVLAERAPADLSLVLWPENSSDIDPFRNEDARAQITQGGRGREGAAARRCRQSNGPIRHHMANASLLYRPGVEIPERYDKLHPVPFAEYIPYRSFFRTFSDKVDLVRRDFVAGTSIGAFSIPVRDR